jgi:putative hydrolase of the HAD superfamily
VTRIQAVISDFGGVLTTPLFHAFAGVQASHGFSLEELGRAMIRATAERGENPLYEMERGELAEAEFLSVLEGALSTECGRPVSLDQFGEQYFQALQPNEAMIAHLRSLRDSRGMRLAMLTNNVREWESRWRPMLPVDELFEFVVDSAFVGMRKPEPGIYALTLERLGLPAEACVFVDDVDVNCDAAREAGMSVVHFLDTDQAIRDLDAVLARDGAGA